MLFSNKILVFFIVLSWGTLFTFAQSVGSSENIESFSAAQKGYEILGTILHNSPHEDTNVVLLKNLSNNQTMAKKVGNTIVVSEPYLLIAVNKDFIDLRNASQKLRLYKYGVAPPARNIVKAVEKPVAITGSYKEEGFEREGGRVQISQDYRKKILEKDLPKILMQAAAEPKLDANGNIIGFALYDIEKGSIYAKAGLSDGDVITNINGEDLSSPQGAVKLLNSLRNVNDISVTIQRGGQSIPLNLDVK